MDVETDPVESHIIRAFKTYSADLSAKHDKYERIVKISRDITIESKRLIFTIHSLPKERGKTAGEAELNQIRDRFKNLVDTHFKRIANELRNEDPYMYHRAYTWGVQEYVEALTYFTYVTSSSLVSWEEIVQHFNFTANLPIDNGDSKDVCQPKSVKLLIPLSDYILGIQDMTGELMRLCITSLGKKNTQGAHEACNFVKYIYAALHLIHRCHNEFYKKLEVAEQSLKKMEYGCYLAEMQSTEFESGLLRSTDAC